MALLDEVMVDELVELEESTICIALNLESNNVGDMTQSNKMRNERNSLSTILTPRNYHYMIMKKKFSRSPYEKSWMKVFSLSYISLLFFIFI